MEVLGIRWKRKEKTSYKKLSHPNGTFKVRYGWVYTGRFHGIDHRLHVCIDEYDRLCAVIDGEKSAVLEMQPKPQRFIRQEGQKTHVYHDGTMTVSTRIPNKVAVKYVAKTCPTLITDREVYLGALHGKHSSWDTVKLSSLAEYEPGFLRRFLAYALLRQQLKIKIRERRSDPNKHNLRSLRRNSLISRMKYGLGGESSEHKNLKYHIAKNPWLLRLPKDLRGECEYRFPTGDRADIAFLSGKKIHSIVEIETAHSDTRVGMYQAVKYRSLTAACKRHSLNTSRIRAFLVAPLISDAIKEECSPLKVSPLVIQLPIGSGA